MLKEKERWVIRFLNQQCHSIRQISDITHHHRKTIRLLLAKDDSEETMDGKNSVGRTRRVRRSGRPSILEPFKEFIFPKIKEGVCTAKLLLELRDRGFIGSSRSLQRFLSMSKAKIITTTEQMNEWMHLVLQGGNTSSQVIHETGGVLTDEEVTTLLECVRTKPLKLRNRALSLLAYGKGINPGRIASFLCITRQTARKYISDFKNEGIDRVLDLSRKEVKKAEDPNYAAAVFKTLHAPPNAFGFNRNSWRMDDLYAVLLKQGVRISRANIRKIIKTAGYRFRKAKKVLTSTDPEYREKLEKIKQILNKLKPEEKFFSIDEFGPFAIKITGGRAWAKPDELRIVPQWQKSKGRLIATAALELSTNQITHFYSEKKNTDEMIRLLDLLVRLYRGQTRIFLSWDAASWHGSKKFFGRVDEVNQPPYRAEHGTPAVELAPLPSCAQFLNVIEAVFSGMARAIIHNSDYASVEAAKEAIDRYFAERNDHFQKCPRRAGNKLWGKELIDPEFNETNNCKDPRW